MSAPARRPRAVVVVAAIFFTALATIAAAEAFVRLVRPNPAYKMWNLSVELDESYLFRVRTAGEAPLNRRGYHDRDWDDDDPRPRVYVLGDSFVMALLLPAEKTLPGRLQTLLGPSVSVRNLGVHGYGPEQSLLRFLGEERPRPGDVVVLTLYAGNDLEDLLRNEMVDADAGGELVIRASNPVKEALPHFRSVMVLRGALTGSTLGRDEEYRLMVRLFYDLYVPPDRISAEDVERSHRLMGAVLRRLKQEAAARGLTPLVLVVPSWEAIVSPSYFDEHGIDLADRFLKETTIERIAQDAEVPWVSLRQVAFDAGAAHYTEGDHHWSEAGAAAAAQAVAERIGVDIPRARPLRSRAMAR